MPTAVEAIQLDDGWLQEVLARISLKDEVERVKSERKQVQERLRRLARTYREGLCEDAEYDRQKTSNRDGTGVPGGARGRCYGVGGPACVAVA